MEPTWYDKKETWYSRKVKTYKGSISEIRQQIPCFRIAPFALEGGGVNKNLNLVVREPLKENQGYLLPSDNQVEIPIATVSHQYELVQHHNVLEALETALKQISFNPECLETELTLTEYGERMRVSFTLPNYDFNPGDGHPIVLKVNAFNSVDTTTALSINLSWYRLVCSNGMMFGTANARFRRIHLQSHKPKDITKFLEKQLSRAPKMQSLYKQWYERQVFIEAKPSAVQIEHWIDDTVEKRWGVHAAARVYHIAKTGYDGKLDPPEQKVPPTKQKVQSTNEVPGSFAPVRNAYGISQVLSWIASRRGTIQDQLDRMMDIPYLMRALLKEEKPITLSMESLSKSSNSYKNSI